MAQLSLPIRPEDATKSLLKKLPSRRMRDVLEKRYGLKGGKRKTLEAIGREYKITRERVRQIETEALKQLGKPEHYRDVEPLLKNIENHFQAYGAVLAEHHFLNMLPASRFAPHVGFLLHVGKPFSLLAETDNSHKRWTTNKVSADSIEKILEKTKSVLAEHNAPVSEAELMAILAENAEAALGTKPEQHVLEAYLNTSKAVKKNTYGEYGLASWATISPRGVKDKAYLVLFRSGKPMHFREVAEAINKAHWSKKKAHPQTVHNELIKDKRFVLVGRGLYALKEWGYEPGTVRDILVSVFKKAQKPLSKEEAIRLVLERRFVKPPTILLNLQDRNLFKRIEGEKYTLS